MSKPSSCPPSSQAASSSSTTSPAIKASAEKAIRAQGAWHLFWPPYSPDLNPIEMAFVKLKADLCARAVRIIDDLWKAVGNICAIFTSQVCSNYFNAAGYGFK